MLKKAFTMFDSGKRGTIEKEKVRTILNTLGHFIDDVELETVIDEVTSPEFSGKVFIFIFHKI